MPPKNTPIVAGWHRVKVYSYFIELNSLYDMATVAVSDELEVVSARFWGRHFAKVADHASVPVFCTGNALGASPPI